jgi:predicted RNA-binding protein
VLSEANLSRKYWSDLFTGKTREGFLKHGASVSGFSERRKKIAEKIQSGDYLICYLTGISRLIGIVEVKSIHHMLND